MNSDWELVPTAANGQPAFGLYRTAQGSAVPHRFGIGVLDTAPTHITQISMFVDDANLFDLFGLPGGH